MVLPTSASLAQLAEHALRKRTVVGSIPTGGSLHRGFVIPGLNESHGHVSASSPYVCSANTKVLVVSKLATYIFSPPLKNIIFDSAILRLFLNRPIFHQFCHHMRM